ncbi:hypothetical protein CEQ31_022985 [Serratia odorifera]|nr:hypothetical protein CEQ31_022985 [Serratia odorifera]RII73334.1 hypothetical protein DX901_03500 [Serratia odorifera]
MNIPLVFQAASLLAAAARPSHLVVQAVEDAHPCRLNAARNPLGNKSQTNNARFMPRVAYQNSYFT